jgi:selT/selW/selH-like putative selenoprotein
LAEEIYKALGVKAVLTEGSKGVFDVFVDGKRIFSRAETGRLPEPDEIIGRLKSPS